MGQKRGKSKSEKHHWWPECVSQHWQNEDGNVNWLSPNGEIKTAPPKNFGCIGNGHFIKYKSETGDPTPWDYNFEPVFDKADGGFPFVIEWLMSLKRETVLNAKTLTDRFLVQETDDEVIAQLVESIVSMAIRSPMQRETGASAADALWGPNKFSRKERNSIIASNMRYSQKEAVSQIKTRGKYAVLYSPAREFIYGDGFFHNFRSPVQPQLNNFKMLLPITPEISVLFAQPKRYFEEPRLSTLVLEPHETDILNDVIQIYSCEQIFYRSEQPKITPEFSQGEHLRYMDSDNPVDRLISQIPGVRDLKPFI